MNIILSEAYNNKPSTVLPVTDNQFAGWFNLG
jgi:hypothetical protein